MTQQDVLPASPRRTDGHGLALFRVPGTAGLIALHACGGPMHFEPAASPRGNYARGG
jgi:hypothetical protein